MDYLHADASVLPAGVAEASALYAERLVLLPSFFLAADHAASAKDFGVVGGGGGGGGGGGSGGEGGEDQRVERPLPTLGSGSPSCASLSSFSQPYKLRPETLAVWANGLRRLPPSCPLHLLRFREARACPP